MPNLFPSHEPHEVSLHALAQLHSKAQIGQISSGLLHDIVKPIQSLGAILSECSQCSYCNRKEIIPALNRVFDTVRQASTCLAVAKSHNYTQENTLVFSLYDACKEACTIVEFHAQIQNTSITIQGPRDYYITGNKFHFHRLITNLVSNALDACKTSELSKTSIVICFSETDSDLSITVTDSGSGIPEEIREKIFEPFFSTKKSSQGIGLGLSICKEIMERSFKGTITCDSIPGHGTTITLLIPNRHRKQSV